MIKVVLTVFLFALSLFVTTEIAFAQDFVTYESSTYEIKFIHPSHWIIKEDYWGKDSIDINTSSFKNNSPDDVNITFYGSQQSSLSNFAKNKLNDFPTSSSREYTLSETTFLGKPAMRIDSVNNDFSSQTTYLGVKYYFEHDGQTIGTSYSFVERALTSAEIAEKVLNSIRFKGDSNYDDPFDFSIFDNESSNSDSNPETNSEGGGCLIATATFGSEMSSQVQQLRELRDNTLLATDSGTAFMTGFNQGYYLFSPTIADLEREHPIFKEFMKITLTPMISSLSILNHVDMDSEHEVLGYGISMILLNVGMYAGIPLFGMMQLIQYKKRN